MIPKTDCLNIEKENVVYLIFKEKFSIKEIKIECTKRGKIKGNK